MPTERIAATARRHAPRAAVFLLVFFLLGQTACTRDDVAAGVVTVADQLETALGLLGATTEAPVAALGSRVPEALNTAPATQPSDLAGIVAQVSAGGSPTAVFGTPPPLSSPTAVLTPPPTPTLAPSPTASATPEPTATATPLPSPTPVPPLIEVDGGTMALVAGGFFEMGATAADLLTECERLSSSCRSEWFTPSEPVHSVLLAPFYMDSHEVTNDAFARFLNASGGPFALCLDQLCLDTAHSQIAQDGNVYVVAGSFAQHPAVGVSWYGAAAFCEWRGARLPSEAEWEKAAAWDNAALAARRYPWGDEFDGRRLNFCDANCNAQQANLGYNDAYAGLAPVAHYENGRSPTGLFDMAGNVWEWVADWYDPAYYAVSPGADPLGPETGDQKVVRGASWYDAGYFAASAIRFPSPPDNTDRTIGFRCAADIP